jgi:hypothetical protein
LVYFPIRVAQGLLPDAVYTRAINTILRLRWGWAARRQGS